MVRQLNSTGQIIVTNRRLVTPKGGEKEGNHFEKWRKQSGLAISS